MGHPFKVWKLAAHLLVLKLGLYIHCLLSEQITIKLNNEYAPLAPVKAMGFGEPVFFTGLFSLHEKYFLLGIWAWGPGIPSHISVSLQWFSRAIVEALPLFNMVENGGVPYLGVLIIRILLFKVLYWGPLFLETPIFFFAIA